MRPQCLSEFLCLFKPVFVPVSQDSCRLRGRGRGAGASGDSGGLTREQEVILTTHHGSERAQPSAHGARPAQSGPPLSTWQATCWASLQVSPSAPVGPRCGEPAGRGCSAAPFELNIRESRQPLPGTLHASEPDPPPFRLGAAPPWAHWPVGNAGVSTVPV